MRDVAGDVGVDAALISRYFGSKEDLFVSALDSCTNGNELTDGPRESFGERVATELIYHAAMPCASVDEGEKMRGLLILLRSIGSAKAMDVVQRTSDSRFYEPLTNWIGGPAAAVRARLVAGLIMGLVLGRELSNGYAVLSADQKRALCDRTAVALQGLVDS